MFSALALASAGAGSDGASPSSEPDPPRADGLAISRLLPRTWPAQADAESGEENLARWSQWMRDPAEYAAIVALRATVPEFPMPESAIDGVPLEWTEIGSGIYRDDGRPAGQHLHWSGRATSVKYSFDDEQGQDVLYLGASSGGLWKLRQVGIFAFWIPISETLDGSPAVGAFVVHRLNSRRIVIGTGDPYRYSGSGFYRTWDGGDTWHRDLTEVNPVVVYEIQQDLVNPGLLLAATQTGIYRSEDFGSHWSLQYSGWVTDVIQDPQEWNRWLAGVQKLGIFESIDGGLHWSKINGDGGTGLVPPFDRIDIDICQSSPSYVYAVISGHKQCKTAAGNYVKGNAPQYDLVCTSDAHCNAPDTCEDRYPALLMNNVYRSTDGGYTWEAIDAIDDISWAQAYHTTAIAVDPDDPDRVFVGMGGWQWTENATAPSDLGFPAVQWRRTTRDSAKCVKLLNTAACDLEIPHADQTSFTFVPTSVDPASTSVLITNDGGYFQYDFALNEVIGEGNYLGLNIAQTMDRPGTFSASWRIPDLMLAGLQDNGIVRVDPNAAQRVLFLGGADGGAVNFSRDNDSDIFFSNGMNWKRYLSQTPPWREAPEPDNPWKNVNCSFNVEGYPVAVSSEMTPGRGNPLMYTNDNNFLWWQPIGPSCAWAQVHTTALPSSDIDGDGTTDPMTVRYFDMANDPLCRVFYVSDPKSRVAVIDDCGGQPMGSLKVETERTPPIPFTGRSMPYVFADRSSLQPETVYYATGLARPSQVWISQNRAKTWSNVTGDLELKAPEENYLELIGNPADLNQLFLATDMGVWRTDNGLDPYPKWYRYMAGLPRVIAARGLEFAYDNAPEPALRMASYGRSFWQRSVRSPWGGAVATGFDEAGHQPLLLNRLDSQGQQLELTWSASCSSGDGDYAIYEGELGVFDSHFPLQCSTGGKTEAVISPSRENAYYLVAPLSSVNQTVTEGSLGVTSSGEQRQHGVQFCYEAEINGCP